MADNYEIDPVDEFSVATIGEPGKRRFFLLARSRGNQLTLACEKAQVRELVARVFELLEEKGMKTGPSAPQSSLSPAEPRWPIGQLGLGFQEDRGRFVVVATEAIGEEESEDEASTVRFWLSPEQMRAFVSQASEVLSGGRPLCPRCGLPMDPDGHPCPASNGARPIF